MKGEMKSKDQLGEWERENSIYTNVLSFYSYNYSGTLL